MSDGPFDPPSSRENRERVQKRLKTERSAGVGPALDEESLTHQAQDSVSVDVLEELERLRKENEELRGGTPEEEKEEEPKSEPAKKTAAKKAASPPRKFS